MIKTLIKRILFSKGDIQTIKSGPSAGLKTHFNVDTRSHHLLGLYEREIHGWLNKGIRKAATLVDIGANQGYFVLAFLRTGKKVIACEPGDVSGELISNAALNGFTVNKDFVLEKRLVGSEPDYVSIEELIKGSPAPFFFLVDIDGGEYDLLQTCGPGFDHSQATWLFETHSTELEAQCVQYLQQKGYTVTIIKNGWWRFLIPERRGTGHNRWLYAEYKS